MRKLANNDGLTLKNGKIITYKTGWQVADYGKEAHTPEEAMRIVKEMKGNCGIWYSEGIYYIDHSMRISTKKQALEMGRKYNQISILKWQGMKLIYC
jgi:hypothetical protein